MMRFRRTGVAVALAAATAGLALTACGGGAGQGGQSASKDLVLGNILAPVTFEAASFNWGNQSIYAQAVYDGLLRPAPNGKDQEPDLATKWEYNADKTVLTMTLREGVKFTDGTPFTADVAAQNLLRFRDGTSPQASKIADLKDAKATDETTLVITLKQPNPAFLNYLAQAAGLQESPKAFDSKDVQTTPVGSGPYTLNTAKTVVGNSYVFDKNPDYWNATEVHYDTLTIKVYTDSTSELNALRGKQLNVANIGDNSIVAQVKASGMNTVSEPLNWAGLLLLDRGGTLNPAMGDVKVRQAINFAVDRAAFLKVVGLGYGTVTSQVFNPESVGYDDSLNSRYAYDPDKARQLLQESKYPGAALTIPTSSGFPKQLFPLLQQQLEAVGFKVKFTDVGTNIIGDLQGKKFALSYFTLQRDPNDWQLISFQIAPNATWNTFKYSDPKANKLMETIRTSTGADYDTAMKELNAYVVDQAWFAPWYAPENFFATDANTEVVMNKGNVWPNLWNITPKS
jgi:peptide/nickel transport system substrate-binding protein